MTKMAKDVEIEDNVTPFTWSCFMENLQKIAPIFAVNYKDKFCNRRTRCKIFGAVLLFCLFWLYIIFYISQREPFERIEIQPNYDLPVVENKYKEGFTIPRVFHQLWKNNNIPRKWQKGHEICQNMNSEFKLILWTDEMIHHFMYIHYPWFYNRVFLNYPYNIQRIDVARYFILYHYGGVYLDIDATCKTPFKKLLSKMTPHENVLVPMTDLYGVTNSFMASAERSRFFEFVVYELPLYITGPFTIFRHTTIIFSTGPWFLTQCMSNFEAPKDLHTLPLDDYNNKHFYHAKGGSWHGLDTEIVDIFHFHYIGLLLLVVFVIIIYNLLKHRKKYQCFRPLLSFRKLCCKS